MLLKDFLTSDFDLTATGNLVHHRQPTKNDISLLTAPPARPTSGVSSCCVRPSLPSSATTLDLRSSVCIRLMDTSLHSHTLYLNTDWELPKTRWLDHELTPLPRPQLHAWAWSPTSSTGRQGIRVFVSSPHLRPGRMALRVKVAPSPSSCEFLNFSSSPLF